MILAATLYQTNAAEARTQRARDHALSAGGARVRHHRLDLGRHGREDRRQGRPDARAEPRLLRDRDARRRGLRRRVDVAAPGVLAQLLLLRAGRHRDEPRVRLHHAVLHRVPLPPGPGDRRGLGCRARPPTSSRASPSASSACGCRFWSSAPPSSSRTSSGKRAASPMPGSSGPRSPPWACSGPPATSWPWTPSAPSPTTPVESWRCRSGTTSPRCEKGRTSLTPWATRPKL